MDELLKKDIKCIKGVGDKRAQMYHKLQIFTIKDLLYYFPRSYEDRSLLKSIFETVHGEVACIRATVTGPVSVRRIRQNLSIYTLRVSDGSGIMDMTWFNMHYLKETFHKGETFYFYGKIETARNLRRMNSPIFEREDKQRLTGRIMPVYSLTTGLTQAMLQAAVREALDLAGGQMRDPLTLKIRRTYRLPEINYAIRNIHYPDSEEEYALARKRFVFEELLVLETGLMRMKNSRLALRGIPMQKPDEPFQFPFNPTNAQKRVVAEIEADMGMDKPMNRLVQGDVGCGKTAVAAAAMYLAVSNGYQAALMAPTEILATQHFKGLKKLFEAHHISVELLIGSQTAKTKREALQRIGEGAAQVIVGTHALLGESVVFSRLGLVVTDEQHRFGVEQRKMLSDKGGNPHVLIMTATPIPRTLSLIIYGDLDISVIDELPPGRQSVRTFCVAESMRQRIWRFIGRQIEAGRQVYIVCPLVEDSESMDVKSVTAYTMRLQEEIFPRYRVALLHGKMKGREKEQTMREFVEGQIQILVATSVIEVGVDVPNASLIVIENAERFGLSQLHQLRGRVGRGGGEAYCVLFNQGTLDYAKERMEIMCKTNDGFKISERDLQLRGPGEFFGTRQHGLPPLTIANIFTDLQVIGDARECAQNVLAADPDLLLAEHDDLREQTQELFNRNVTFN